MTRRQFFNYLRDCGCELAPMRNSTSGRAVKIINPANGRWTYLDTPVDLTELPPRAI